jgi:hypothetical protein
MAIFVNGRSEDANSKPKGADGQAKGVNSKPTFGKIFVNGRPFS